MHLFNIQMLHFDQHYKIPHKLNSLNRFSTTITGINILNHYQIVQIDLLNRVMDTLRQNSYSKSNNLKTIKTDNYSNNQLVAFSKYMKTKFGDGYYFIYNDRIEFQDGGVICLTNNKAKFQGMFVQELPNYGNIDGHGDTLCFIKYHKNHEKYSINILKQGYQKKIVHLYDEPIMCLQLLKNTNNILHQNQWNMVQILHAQKYNKNVKLRENSYLLFDDNYSYTAQFKQQNKAQYSLRVYQQKNLNNSNNHSLEFNISGKYPPIRIDSFRNDIIVATEQSIRIYDIRKLINPFVDQGRKGISDFYYDPNLQKIYVGTVSGMYTYKYL